MRVIVIGGGMAGLTAAIRLQERRHQATLLERRGVLGGRATSSRDVVTGDEVDNGTHLLVGACHAALDLFRNAGVDDLLHVQENLRLDFVDSRGLTALICPPLSAPLHIAAGLLAMRLAWRERLAALRLGLAVRFNPPRDEETLARYFERTGQTPGSRRLLWDPLATAILNVSPEVASARLFARVFTDSFLRNARSSGLVLLRRGWGVLAARLGAYFEGRDGALRLNASVASIAIEEGHATGVRLAAREGREVFLPADAVVAAVPWYALPALLPPALVANPPFAGLDRLDSSPIVSLDMWLDRRVVTRSMVGLCESELDWVFDKGLLHGRLGPQQHLSFIVSAALRSSERDNAAIVTLAHETLQRCFPIMAEANIVRSLVQREPRATFVCSPAAERLRPGPITPIRGLYLAGDWTNTGLPATIESAVRSGNLAAETVDRGV